MKNTLLLSLHYQPLTYYFALIKDYSILLIEGKEEFRKQTLRNRTYILTANGVHMLSVPVLHASKSIQEIRIDYSQSWLKDHLRSIVSSYKHAPYFDYCFPYYEEIYQKKKTFLFDLNLELLFLSLKILRWEKEVKVTDSYRKEYPDEIEDARHKFEYKEEMGPSQLKKYPQLFGTEFVENVSMLDFIFNCGF